MATDNTGTWILGESKLWYTPTTSLDPMWFMGESQLLDEYVAAITDLSIHASECVGSDGHLA
jgi:hypothetical protein